MQKRLFRLLIGLIAVVSIGITHANADQSPSTLSMIVMDPLAAPLSCPCVEGYAQRKYEVLAEHLEQTTGLEVKLVFGESLSAALKKSGGRADIVIGKDSVVRADAKATKQPLKILGRLTDQSGSTDQYGMIVVNRDDPARVFRTWTGTRSFLVPPRLPKSMRLRSRCCRKLGLASRKR